MGVLKHKAFFVTLIYAVITLFCVLHHEIWSDEAQVWMLAKHLSIPQLLKHLVNEGHPSLFYLIVMPFAKFSNNIIFQQLICWGASCAAIFLLWRYSKFSAAAKTVITLSSPFIYHFPVIARSYSLVAPLVFILAILYPKRSTYLGLYAIALAALANTHAIMFPFAAILGTEFILKNIKEKRKAVIPIAIIVFGLLALIAQLAGTTQSNIVINFANKGDLGAFTRVVMLFIFNSFDNYIIKGTNNYFTPYPVLMALLTVFGAFFFFFFLFKTAKNLFWLLFISVSAQIGIYTFTYDRLIFSTRIYCAYMILLFCFWVLLDDIYIYINKFSSQKTNAGRQIKRINFIIIFVFLLTFINGIKSYYGDIMLEYTPSKRSARFLKNNINMDNSRIYIDNQGYAIAIAYYLYPEYSLYYIWKGTPLKYVVWDNVTVCDRSCWIYYLSLERQIEPNKQFYVLAWYNPLNGVNSIDMPNRFFELIYVTPDTMMPSEMFKLYKYKG